MKTVLINTAAILLMCHAATSPALELGPEDFLAARSMTCVLAQESLGYLSEEEFSAAAESIMTGYDQAQGDVVYAKALGYFDGLMFGLPPGDAGEINARLQAFLSSKSCRRFTSVEEVSHPL